jgi:putative transcriptional regulator
MTLDKQDFDDLLESIGQARTWARGEPVAGVRVHHFPASVEDVRAIRAQTGLSQTAFSRQIGVSAATLRNWEQGRRKPEGPARILLALLARDPAIVTRTLADAA